MPKRDGPTPASLSGKTVLSVTEADPERLVLVFTDGSRLSVEHDLAGLRVRVEHDSSGPVPAAAPRTAPPPLRFTEKQGQYLAFIAQHEAVHGRAPSEAELQSRFLVSPPSVHQMVMTLERHGLISRIPGQARSIRVEVPLDQLPSLGPPRRRS